MFIGSARHNTKGGVSTIQISTNLTSFDYQSGQSIYGNENYDVNQGCVCRVIKVGANADVFFQCWNNFGFEVMPMSFMAIQLS